MSSWQMTHNLSLFVAAVCVSSLTNNLFNLMYRVSNKVHFAAINHAIMSLGLEVNLSQTLTYKPTGTLYICNTPLNKWDHSSEALVMIILALVADIS